MRAYVCADFTGRGGTLPALAGGWTGGIAAPTGESLLADRSPSAIPVDTELVLAVDVSYSMDPEEQALQREGYITGITSREFMQALRGGMHGKVAVTYFEWAGPYDQKIVVPWRLIDGPEAADAFANEIARGALPAGVPHLDLRCADISPSRCSTARAIAASAAWSTSPATAPTTAAGW